MRPLKKLALSLNASFDNLVSQMENHEAIANCAIVEIQTAASKTQVQHRRVKRDLENLSSRKASIEKDITAWEERAKRSYPDDQNTARECLRRVKRLRSDSEAIVTQISETEAVERKLAKDLDKVQQRLAELKRRRNLLLSRDTQAQALTTSSQANGEILHDIDEIFERWEVNVMKKEYHSQTFSEPEDELEIKFSKAEEQEQLDAELTKLVDGQQPEQ